MTNFHRVGISPSIFRVGALAVFSILSVGIANADQIAYISNTVGQNILAWDVTNNTFAASPVVLSTGPIDSLFFASPTELVYSIIGNNQIGAFNCPGGFSATNGLCIGASTNTILSSAGVLNQPSDLTADPSGTSFWVTNAGTKTISQINLATGAAMTTCNLNNMRPDGLTFVGNQLYAVLQTTGNGEELAAVNTTGSCSVTNSIALPSENGMNSMADGLTWDPAAAGGLTTGSFYVASDDGGVYQVNLGLTSQTYTQLLTPAGASNKEFDGITSNLNTLYIINRDIGGVTYGLNAATGAVIPGAVLTSPLSNGADDIAAAIGSPLIIGSPEPTTMLLVGAGMIVIGLGRKYRKQKSTER